MADFAKAALVTAGTYMKDHPYQTGFVTTNAVATLIAGPGALVTIPLQLIGFGPLGPVAGTAAAWYQSVFYAGATPAGGVFATLQALAMTAV